MIGGIVDGLNYMQTAVTEHDLLMLLNISTGNVQIVWLDDSSAFVGLYRRDQADTGIALLSIQLFTVISLLW